MQREARRIAIIGCGSIASVIVEAVAEGRLPLEVTGLLDLEPAKCRSLAEKLGGGPLVAGSLEELLATGPRLVVEAASQEAVRMYGEEILRRGIDLVVLSVGALLDRATLERLQAAARKGSARIYVPSGAIGGLDAVRAARHAGITRLVLRTTKHPRSLGLEEWSGAPRLLYRGPAGEAVKRYPFNVNVAAALALAAGTEPLVEIVADPSIEVNRHEILVESAAGRMHLVFENLPSPGNPRTSLLAALSVIELLRRLSGAESLEVGN